MGKVFEGKPIDTVLLESWLASLRTHRANNPEPQSSVHDNGNPLNHNRAHRTRVVQDRAKWITQRKDIVKALARAGNSSPGPDGIPFNAWRSLRDLGVSILLDVLSITYGGRVCDQALRGVRMVPNVGCATPA